MTERDDSVVRHGEAERQAARALGAVRGLVPLKYGITIVVHEYDGDACALATTIDPRAPAATPSDDVLVKVLFKATGAAYRAAGGGPPP